MIIKFNIQSLILTLFFLSICSCFVVAQTGKKVAEKSIPQIINVEKWGLEFSVPADMKEISLPENNPIKADEITDNEKTFERPANSKLKISRLNLSVNTNVWKGEKLKTEVDGIETELMPEQMLEINFTGDSADINRADSPQIEAKYLEIDGQKGIFVVRNASQAARKTIKPENQIIVIWGTYRIYEGNIQQVTMTFEGKRKDIDTMKQVINTIKFQ